jgi:hypothetical protein
VSRRNRKNIGPQLQPDEARREQCCPDCSQVVMYFQQPRRDGAGRGCSKIALRLSRAGLCVSVRGCSRKVRRVVGKLSWTMGSAPGSAIGLALWALSSGPLYGLLLVHSVPVCQSRPVKDPWVTVSFPRGNVQPSARGNPSQHSRPPSTAYQRSMVPRFFGLSRLAHQPQTSIFCHACHIGHSCRVLSVFSVVDRRPLLSSQQATDRQALPLDSSDPSGPCRACPFKMHTL